MAANEEAQENLEGETTTDLDTEDEKKKIVKGEKDTDKDPDLADPRLFSPLQEPDRPTSHERSIEEQED